MNSKPVILFRADGNSQIGLGHVMRCLALAEMLGSDYDYQFAIVEPSTAVAALITAKGIRVIALPTSAIDDFREFINADTVVVLDGYAFDTAFQLLVREQAKRLVYIDDLVAGHQVADVVINHAGGVTTEEYEAEPYTQFVLGSRYALLRTAFFIPFTPAPTEGPIFISLGGADPSHTSVRVLNGILTYFNRLNQQWRIHMIVGPLQANRPELEALQSQFRHLHLLSNLTAEQMAAELTKCQLAITACSTVAYEVCSVGRPLIAIQTADNQARIASFLAGNSMASVFSMDTLSTANMDLNFEVGVSATYFHARRTMVQHQRRLFDGRSPERFRALFKHLCN